MSAKKLVFNAFSGTITQRIDSQTARTVFRAVTSLFTGLVASRAMILDGLSPFGIAAVTAASKTDGLFVLLGTVIGYMMPAGPQYAARYVTACAAAFLFKWIFTGLRNIADSPAFSPLIAGSAALLTGMAVAAAGGLAPSDIVLCLAETLICACACVFFEQASPYLHRPSRLWEITRHELVSVIISLCVLLLALSRIGAGGLTAGRILGVLCVLIAARCGREAAGSITGTALALSFTLGDRSMAGVVAGYAFGGLMAGVFSPLGRFGCTTAFILANAAAVFGTGFSAQAVSGLYEVLAATVIFMLLPEKWITRVSILFVPASQAARGGTGAENVTERLTAAAGALCGVSDTVRKVGDKLRGISDRAVSQVYDDAADITCKRCGMRMYCWGTAYNDTMNTLNGLTETLTRNSELKREDVPKYFASRCCRLGDLLSSVNRCYAQYAACTREQGKNDMLRGVLTEEFGGLAAFLQELGREFSGAMRAVPGSEGVRAALAGAGLNVRQAVCLMDEKGHMTVEADVLKKGKTVISRSELLKGLAQACGREFDGPTLSGGEETLTLGFSEKPAYSAAFGRAFIPKSGEQLCGDACDAFVDEHGRALLILSDGMGCGGRAAVDSNLALSLISSLLRAGFGYEAAVKVVNSAMILKSGDESFATLDITAVDLYSGEAEFLKAGAPPTYIRRCGRVERVTLNSIPVGILRGVGLEKGRAHLRRGDVIVLLSDGALCGSDTWLIHAIEQYGGEPPDEFAAALAAQAKESRTDGHDDDITVLAAVLE